MSAFCGGMILGIVIGMAIKCAIDLAFDRYERKRMERIMDSKTINPCDLQDKGQYEQH